jgi:hypothetical protein
MTFSVSRRGLAAGIALALGAGILAGCTATAPGDLGRLQTLLAACPDGKKINDYEALDGSGTTQSEEIAREYLAYVKSRVEKVAVCGGHISIVIFGTNSITVPIYEGDLQVEGATDLARLRRVPALVDEVIAEVTKHYQSAVALLPKGGTDVTGLLRLLEEAQALRPDMELEASILTDGLNNQGIVIDRVLSPEEATALADTVAVPQLSGSVAIIGIGRVSGAPLSSDFIAGMKVFYTRLLERTGASSVLVLTDGR